MPLSPVVDLSENPDNTGRQHIEPLGTIDIVDLVLAAKLK
jgi:hypothetical protein